MIVFAHVRDRFAEAFFPRLSEWVTAGAMIAIGMMLAYNTELMSAGDTRGYALMLAIAGQQTWARIMIGFGAICIIVLFVNGAWRRSPHFRAVTAFLRCFVWTQIMLSFAAIMGFSFVFAGSFLFLDMCNILRAARDAHTVDEAYARDVS